MTDIYFKCFSLFIIGVFILCIGFMCGILVERKLQEQNKKIYQQQFIDFKKDLKIA